MKLITASQCRAARGLLNWSQPDLAQRCGVHVQTISGFENETNSPTKTTLEKLASAFDAAGIEFSDFGGIEPKQSRVVTFHGKDGFALFRKDILFEASMAPLDVCVSNVDEREFDKWGEGSVNEEYFTSMLLNMPKRFRILVKENDDHLSAPNYATYRWLSKEYFGRISFFVYAHKTAIISFEDNDFQAFVISHKKISDFYRKEFDDLWSLAQEPMILKKAQ